MKKLLSALSVAAMMLAVTALAQGRMSPPSNVSSATTLPGQTNIISIVTVSPNAPIIGASPNGTTNELVLTIVPGAVTTFPTNNAPVGFEVRRSTVNLGSTAWPASTIIGTNLVSGSPGATQTVTDNTGLQPNTTYYYQVGAFN